MLVADPRSNHDDGNIRQACIAAHTGSQLIAIHTRHLDIQQDHVRYMFLQYFQRINAIFGSKYAHAMPLQQALRNTTHRNRIIYNQHKGTAILSAGHQFTVRTGTPFRTYQRAHIENDDHPTIAENSGSRDAANARHLRPNRLHYNFPVTDQFVGYQCGGMLTRLDQYQRHFIMFRQHRYSSINECTQILHLVALTTVLKAGHIAIQMCHYFGFR